MLVLEQALGWELAQEPERKVRVSVLAQDWGLGLGLVRGLGLGREREQSLQFVLMERAQG